MTGALGIKAPLDASVFSAAGGAFVLASCAEYPFSVDQLQRDSGRHPQAKELGGASSPEQRRSTSNRTLLSRSFALDLHGLGSTVFRDIRLLLDLIVAQDHADRTKGARSEPGKGQIHAASGYNSEGCRSNLPVMLAIVSLPFEELL